MEYIKLFGVEVLAGLSCSLLIFISASIWNVLKMLQKINQQLKKISGDNEFLRKRDDIQDRAISEVSHVRFNSKFIADGIMEMPIFHKTSPRKDS